MTAMASCQIQMVAATSKPLIPPLIPADPELQGSCTFPRDRKQKSAKISSTLPGCSMALPSLFH
jgi:hypothetical protein